MASAVGLLVERGGFVEIGVVEWRSRHRLVARWHENHTAVLLGRAGGHAPPREHANRGRARVPARLGSQWHGRPKKFVQYAIQKTRNDASVLVMTDAPLMLSVSGARGIVGATMTPAVAERFASAWGTHLRSQTDGGVRVVLGRDPRPSGAELVGAARAGLQAAGCDVVDLGIAATPTVGFAVGRFEAAGGLMVTASHNPIEWNGIKCLDHRGVATACGRRAGDCPAQNNDVQTGGSGQSITDDSLTGQHVERVLAAVPVRGVPGPVVLDSVNGAGCEGDENSLPRWVCPMSTCTANRMVCLPDRPNPFPPTLVTCAIGFATLKRWLDLPKIPDADRLVLVDERGVPIHEECTLALAATWVLRHRGPGVLVANLSTSRMIDRIAEGFSGAKVVRSAVGEANVVDAMEQSNAILGGEGNGGVIDPEVVKVRDSITGMAMVLDLLAEEGRPLSALVADLPNLAMVKEARLVGHRRSRRRCPKCWRRFARRTPMVRSTTSMGFGWIWMRGGCTFALHTPNPSFASLPKPTPLIRRKRWWHA